MEDYKSLRAFPNVVPGLEKMTSDGHQVVTSMVVSNGVGGAVHSLLDRAGVLPHLDDVLSVDGLKTFKPDP